MTVLLEFPGTHAARPARHRAHTPTPCGAILDQLAAMDDAVEIAQDQLADGSLRQVDVLADVFRAGLAWAAANLTDTPVHDAQTTAALDALDHITRLPDGAA